MEKEYLKIAYQALYDESISRKFKTGEYVYLLSILIHKGYIYLNSDSEQYSILEKALSHPFVEISNVSEIDYNDSLYAECKNIEQLHNKGDNWKKVKFNYELYEKKFLFRDIIYLTKKTHLEIEECISKAELIEQSLNDLYSETLFYKKMLNLFDKDKKILHSTEVKDE